MMDGRRALAERLVKAAGESGDDKTGTAGGFGGFAVGEYVRDTVVRNQPCSSLELWFLSKSIAQHFAQIANALPSLAIYQLLLNPPQPSPDSSMTNFDENQIKMKNGGSSAGMWWEEMNRQRAKLRLEMELKNKQREIWDGQFKDARTRLVVRDNQLNVEVEVSIAISTSFPNRNTECDLNFLCYDGDTIMSADEIRFPAKTLRRQAELGRASLLREFVQANPPETVEHHKQKLITKGFSVFVPPIGIAPKVPARPFTPSGPNPSPITVPPHSPPLLSAALKRTKA
jgi:hypothetical protein